MRTIRVTGSGRIKVRPDRTRITITLEGTYPDYDKTLQHSSEDTEQLRELVTGFGFAPEELKTLYFHVDTQYEGYQEDGVYKQRFLGYRFQHTMKLEFDSDNERLGRVLYALANCPVKPEFRLSYTVKDPEAAKNELLGKAVTDAQEKASVLTQAAGISLKDIQSIDYSWGQINFEVQPMNRMLMGDDCLAAPMVAEGASYDMVIEPDDIEVSDTVTVIWEIG